jgi:hypothetical protein
MGDFRNGDFMAGARSIALTMAVLISTQVHAQEDKVETGNATYEIRPDPKNEDRKCVFRDGRQLLCIERELVSFGAVVRTKDFVLLPIYDDCGGSACGRSQTTLLIERGKEVKIDRSLKRFCVECQNKFQTNADANQITIALDRKDGHAFSALFKNGTITISKKPLDPKEALSDDDCSYLYEDLLDTCIGTPKCRNVVARLPGANALSLNFMSAQYAAFPKARMASMCQAACASKKKPVRAEFDREICRRP